MRVPVEPGADEARRLLETELTKAEYHQGDSLLTRLLRWLDAQLPDPSATGAGWSTGLVVVLALLLVGLVVLLWRVRDVRQVAAERRRREGGLTDPARSAQSYRDEARRLLAAGCVDQAVVAAFRALVVTLDERDVVHDAPGRTAHEVAVAAAGALPARADRFHRAAGVFDRACYGHPAGPLPGPEDPQRCTIDDAEQVLALGAEPVGAR